MSEFDIKKYDIVVSINNEHNEKTEDPTVNKIYPDLSNVEELPFFEKKEEIDLFPKESTDFCKWLLDRMNIHGVQIPAKIAIIEEVGEARCVTYEELIDGAKRTANFMSYHGVKSGDRVLICMENSVEYVFYLFGTFSLGVTPILINPNHLTSQKLIDIEFTSAIVDFENYGQLLKLTESSLQSIQRIFVLADDIASIKIPRHVWILDGFGFLSFTTNYETSRLPQSNHFLIMTGSQTGDYIAHSLKSSFHLCRDFYSEIFKIIEKSDENHCQNHLVTSSLHTHNALFYLLYVLVRGETCVLTEANHDVWRASFLDRMAGIMEQYRIPLLFSNTQLLKCFIKYEVHKIYNLKFLKMIVNMGSVLSVSIAEQVKKLVNVVLIQAYAATQFGIASFGVFEKEKSTKRNLVSCGTPVGNMKIKIAGIESGKELENDNWGQIIVSGSQLFSAYLDISNKQEKPVKSWFETGDYGMIDKDNVLHCEGPIADVINTQNKTISSESLENCLCNHKSIDDVVVMTNNNKILCGVLLKNDCECPSVEQLEKLLKKHKIHLAISKIIVLDFIPRSESGKLLRSELPFLFQIGENESTVVEQFESSI